MSHPQSAVPAPLPIPLPPRNIVSSVNAGQDSHAMSEVLVYTPGPMPCRCGRYLSEDFDGRLFCRGCESTDPSDITARLPLCHRIP